MKTWVKGGLIGFVVGILLIILVSFLPVNCVGLTQDGVSCKAPQGFDAFIVNFTSMFDNIGKVIIYFIIPLIVLGALIGFVVGRYKSKKRGRL